MQRIIVVFVLFASLSLWAGCKGADVAQTFALGSRHKITLYGATGTVIGQWESTGSVSNEASSDGWYFKDEKTGKLIEINGTIVIEQE